MDFPYIHGRRAMADATHLIDHFGAEAMVVAARRARDGRAAGNVWAFCHWRQIERVIAALDCHQGEGLLH